MTASGVNLHSGDLLHAHITYDGTTLTLTLTDTITGASFTASQAINIPATVGGNTAYVGFTAGTGHLTSVQEITNWTYTSGLTAVVNDPAGFSSAAGLNLIGVTLSGGTLQLTDGGGNEANAVWSAVPVNVQNFTSDFTFQESSANADGFTFTLQNAGAGRSVPPAGVSGSPGSVPASRSSSTCTTTPAKAPTPPAFISTELIPSVPALDMTVSGVNLHGTDLLHAHVNYDGTTLSLVLTDTVTGASFSASKAIDIPTTVGGNIAYVGFTAGTGGQTAVQQILNWTYVVN